MDKDCLNSLWANILSANELEGIFDNVTDYQLEAEAPVRMGESEKIQTIYFGLRKEHVCERESVCARKKLTCFELLLQEAASDRLWDCPVFLFSRI